LPERRASLDARARQEQRARGRLAELRREQRACAELAQEQLLDLVGIGDDQLRRGRLVGFGEAHDEAVVAPHRLDVERELLPHFRRDHHRPGRVDAPTEGGEHADAPVAQLVHHALDDDGLIVRHRAGRFLLIDEILHEVLGRELIEIVLRRQALDGVALLRRADLAHELADRFTERNGALGGVGLPERHLPRLSRRGCDDDFVVRDVLDAPRRRAEDESLAGGGLEDHLLIQLADARGLVLLGAGEEDAVQTAVGNRAAARDGDAFRALPRVDRVGHAVPRQARPQLREFVGGIEPGEHVQHAVEGVARQLRERRGRTDRGEQLVGVPGVDRHHRHDLLRQHVERVARIARRLDRSFVHCLRDRGAGDEIAAELRHDDAARRRADLMAGASDALHARRDGRRRLDLNDEIDRAHVDAQLQRRRRHERRQPSRLQRVLDLHALCARDGTVMRGDERLARQFVQRAGKPFRESPRVHEDQRRRMRLDQLEQPRMNGRPDRRRAWPQRRRSALDVHRLGGARHVLDRYFDAQRELLLLAGVDDGDGAEGDLRPFREFVVKLLARVVDALLIRL
jgi:hypothetical protein